MRRGVRRRGQAIAELVLGLAVFITVLIFGLHFAEVSHLALKTHEAMAAAAWDATSYRVERPGVDGVDPGAWYDVSRIAAPRVTTTTNARYADWDGRQSTSGSTGPTQVFTRANGLTTTCTRNGNPAYGFLVPATAGAPTYGEPGALSCVSQGSVSALNIPTSFLQDADRGFFSVAHVRRDTFTLCGLGRPTGGTCRGALNLLLGDHGLTSGNNESEECVVRDEDVPGETCANRVFYGLAHNTWDRSMGWTGAPEDFARSVTGSAPPGRVTGFYMSFRGEGAFGETQERLWQTQPMDYNLAGGVRGTYRQAYNASNALMAPTTTQFIYLGRYTCD